MDLTINEIKTEKSKIVQPQCSKYGMMEHPFRMYICGSSGSGKTNMMLNLLSKDVFYKDYFDEIFVISPTASSLDKSYKVLDLPQNRYYQPNTGIVDRIMEINREGIERKGIKNTPKVLVILDDIISYKKFVNSNSLIKLFVMGRHYNISLIVLSQAYHRIPKSIRLNCSCFCYFRGSQKEVKVICEDLCPPGVSHKGFTETINKVTKKRYSFLFVDLNRPQEDRYKQNFDMRIEFNSNHLH